MPDRRILSLWFPRLGAERLLRLDPGAEEGPFAVVEERRGMQVLTALSPAASAAGLVRGQPLQDALALCPSLVTRPRDPVAEAAFLTALRRWAGKFSPWVSEEPPAALMIDLSGAAHLFGGEAALLEKAAEECAQLGLTVRAGIADSAGAAWALARFAGVPAGGSGRGGDAIDQEARATRSRAAKRRHWERGGPAPARERAAGAAAGRIAAPGQTRQALAALPLAALRLEPDTVEALNRLGLRRIDDLFGQPRAGLARRFGRELVQRLDQALGIEPEPISPAQSEVPFAVRLTLPEPIGLEANILAAIDRLLPRLEAALRAKGRGARRVRLDCFRSDHGVERTEIGLAQATARPDQIRPLLALRLGGIDAGFGIDRVRIEAVVTEPVQARQHRNRLGAGEAESPDRALLIGRLGARIGMEAITRQHPGDSHIPEKAVITMAAAWSEPVHDWPAPPVPRPVLIWRPEPVTAEDTPSLPAGFRWRRRDFEVREAVGPERIAPEWWLDTPEWRSGVRDYWRVTTAGGERLWLYYAHGGTMSSGWFCQGAFA